MSFSDDYLDNDDSEIGFKKKLEIIEGENFNPPFETLTFDRPQLGMDDVNRLRSMKLKKYTK